jgi:hypothetical protein
MTADYRAQLNASAEPRARPANLQLAEVKAGRVRTL